MIYSTSFGLFSREISCLSFYWSWSSGAFSYASFLSDSEYLSNLFPMDKSLLSSLNWIFFEWFENHACPWCWKMCWPLYQTSRKRKNQCCVLLLGLTFLACALSFLFSFACQGAILMNKHWWSFGFARAQVTHWYFRLLQSVGVREEETSKLEHKAYC